MSNPLGNTVVFGGSVGSEGKGAIVGYLARKHKWAAAICSFMTNAGHSFVEDDGRVDVFQQLPVATVSTDIPHILVGPGSAITLSQLAAEIEKFQPLYDIDSRLKIHPRAVIIEADDIEFEMMAMSNGSTAKGCGSAQAKKSMRVENTAKLARDITWLKPYIADTTQIVNDIIDQGGDVLVEGSQGFDLDLNHGISYPHCTSRGTTPMQVLADCGIAGSVIQETIAVLRTYPIRVGHVVEHGQVTGHSGPFGGAELTWDEITRRSGYPTQLAEYTTVTKRLRRIFEMDLQRLLYMASVCRPTSVALTFADYLDWTLSQIADPGSIKAEDLPHKVQSFVANVEAYTGAPVCWLKTGPHNSDLIAL